MYPSSPTKEKKRASIQNSRCKTTGKTASLRTGKASRKPLPPRAKKLRTTKKTAHTEEERKAILENDVYTSGVGVHQVTCRGCGRTIKTDRRSTYYPGLWEKHRERCRGVVKMEDEKGRKVCGLYLAVRALLTNCVVRMSPLLRPRHRRR
jgi:hypothetical protein